MKTKRVISFLLTVVMLLTFMVLSASAASVIMPRASCLECGSTEVTYYTSVLYPSTITVSSCSKVSGVHKHSHNLCQNNFICRSCGYTFGGSEFWQEICRG